MKPSKFLTIHDNNEFFPLGGDGFTMREWKEIIRWHHWRVVIRDNIKTQNCPSIQIGASDDEVQMWDRALY